MNSKSIISLFLLLVAYAHSHGQNDNTLHFGICYARTALIDEQASPLLYHHNGITLDLGYRGFTGNGLWIVELSGGLGSFVPADVSNRYWYITDGPEGAISDSLPLGGTLYHAQAQLGYLHKLNRGEKIKTYLGASVVNTTFYSDNIVRVAWFNATSGNVEFLQTFTPGTRHHFLWQVSMPLLARTTRLPWHNSISAPDGESNVNTLFSESTLSWPGNYQQIDLHLEYQYTLGQHFSAGIGYDATWLQYTRDLTFRSLQQNISVIGQFTF